MYLYTWYTRHTACYLAEFVELALYPFKGNDNVADLGTASVFSTAFLRTATLLRTLSARAFCIQFVNLLKLFRGQEFAKLLVILLA